MADRSQVARTQQKPPDPRRPQAISGRMRKLTGASAAKARPPSMAWVMAVRMAVGEIIISLYERYRDFGLQEARGLREVLEFQDKLAKIEQVLEGGAYYSGMHVEMCARSVLCWADRIRAAYPMSQDSSRTMVKRLANLKDAINSHLPHQVALAEQPEQALEP